MHREELIENLAKQTAMCDASDLNSLAALHDQFEQLRDALDDPATGDLAGAAHDAGELVERIVLREVADAEAALNEVRKAAAFLQEALEAIASGEAPPESPDFSSALGAPTQAARDPELVEAWAQSVEDAIGEIEPIALRAERGESQDDDVAEVRRRIHTIKGEAGVLSLADAQSVLHEFETELDGCDELPVERTLAVVDWLRSCIASLQDDPNGELPPHEHSAGKGNPGQDMAPGAEAAASEIEDEKAGGPADADGGDPAEPIVFENIEHDENMADFLSESREHIANAEGALLELEETPTDGELINTVFRAFHTIKGVAGFLHLDPIVRLAHSAEFLLDAARKQSITLTSATIDLILKSCDQMSRLIEAIEGAPGPMRGELDGLIRQLDDAAAGKEPTANNPAPVSTPKKKSTSDSGGGDAANRTRRRDQTVKVSTTRMDALVDMVGELVIAQQMIVQDPTIQSINDQRVQRNLTHTGKIIRDLQEVAMSLRMVTLKALFQKMSRLVRDVSNKAGKRIRLEIEGEDTELDRTVVEEISDPLVHMIRNACDHGIEPEDERVRAGKPPIGTLSLRAYHRGGSIVIEVADDGRGLDREKILKKAMERGLVGDRDPADISDDEVHNMIFLPGFSTAEKVTDISGRGVGMDVVRRNIEALRGHVEIRSKKGEGSTFYMRLPLTMAIIDGMVVRVGTQRYVVPTLNIEQSFRPTPEQLHTVAGGRGEMAMVRGSLLAVHRLKSLFGLHEGEDDLTSALLLVLDANGDRACLVVDEILGQQQVVIKNLGRGLGSIRGVSGGAILGDGRVAPILDVSGLLASAAEQGTQPGGTHVDR